MPAELSVLQLLSGGDRRSIGEANRVAAMARDQPELIKALIRGIESADPVLRMRCADAMEKATADRPELLVPYKKKLLGKLSKIEQHEVRWHVAPMLVRLPLSKAEEVFVMRILFAYTNDPSGIVKTMAMQALAELAFRNHGLLPEIERRIEELTVTGTPAVRARGRKLLVKLEKVGYG